VIRRLELFADLLRALPRELIAGRKAAAYRYYLAQHYPGITFGAGCIVDEKCSFGDGVVVFEDAHLESCTVGRYSYIGVGSQITQCEIGSFCSIGPMALIGLATHPVGRSVSTYPGFYSVNNPGCRISFVHEQCFPEHVPKTIVGNDVWIGARVVVLGGVKISSGAIVGAGAVVTKDVSPFEVVAGVPAKLIRLRFSPEQIQRLLQIKWWDRSLEWITSRAHLFSDIDLFSRLTDEDGVAQLGERECY
jgi:acetyltransferase-like isoleucine patch superfamily enzyme